MTYFFATVKKFLIFKHKEKYFLPNLREIYLGRDFRVRVKEKIFFKVEVQVIFNFEKFLLIIILKIITLLK
jgi:hypothetical protein